MPIRSIVIHASSVGVVVERQLATADVQRIRAALDSAPRGMRVEVDLSGAPHLDAHALMLLGRLLADAAARPTYRGLSESGHRLMRYLGFEVEKPRPPGGR